jgi:hypothetical protein
MPQVVLRKGPQKTQGKIYDRELENPQKDDSLMQQATDTGYVTNTLGN